ncbi:MAG: aspartate kinase [Actinomycetia bacterium]|nr:aspartate kinase [Actinomycetes bacterium]
MSIVVQKFGGTSVADVERIKRVAGRVAATVRAGHQVVVVVSAMGHTTDELVDLAAAISSRPDPQTMDVLLATGEQVSIALVALALMELGIRARALLGGEAGIRTDGVHQRARVVAVDPEPLNTWLARGVTPVVAGFQGVAPDGTITTLGRGGSDLTAVALAAAVRADACEIYSDVAGIYTADPRIVPRVRKLAVVSYEEMMELSSLGAQVLQGRAVDYARAHGVTIHARSTFEDGPGTLITEQAKEAGAMERGQVVTGVAYDGQVAKICLIGVPDRPGVASRIFSELGRHNINVDMIVQSVDRNQVTDLCFTVQRADLTRALDLAREVASAVGAAGVSADENVAKVSAVGAGMADHPGVAATMFAALAERKINIQMISTSEIKISCLVDAEHGHEAVRAIHEAFGLGE